MSRKSKRQICFERIRFSDPGWKAEIIPVSGSTDVAIVMTKLDSYVNRKMYGRVLSQFCHRKTAERLCEELNRYKDEMLAKAFP